MVDIRIATVVSSPITRRVLLIGLLFAVLVLVGDTVAADPTMPIDGGGGGGGVGGGSGGGCGDATQPICG